MRQKVHISTYIKEGKKTAFEIGEFEPHRGDYLVDGGNISKIEFVIHKITRTGTVLFVGTYSPIESDN